MIKLQENMERKYNRRRALFCKMKGRSETNPGYYKYEITVGERDGTLTKHPVYGKDMQSALTRLLHKEKSKWLERKLTAGWVMVLWLIVMGGPAFLNGGELQPVTLLYSFSVIVSLFIGAGIYNSYITKGEQ